MTPARAAPRRHSAATRTDDAASRPSPRRRILDAALALVTEGGYDALQVRAITERADVSSRTIYLHFASLESLAIIAIAEQSVPLYQRLTESPPRNRTPAARINKLISDFTDVMTANRSVMLALLRALTSGKEDVLQYVQGFARILEDMLVTAIADGEASANDREIAEILQNVWFSTLVGWAAGSVSDTHVKSVMRSATKRLLRA